MRWRALFTAVAVLALAGVAVVAVLDAMRDGAADAQEQTAPARGRPLPAGPDLPAAGVLPGRLVISTGPRCRLQVLDLGSLTVGEPGPASGCRVWASPRGDLVAFVRGGERRPEIWVARLGDPPVAQTGLGVSSTPPGWSPSGDRLAYCRADGTSVVVGIDGSRLDRLDGCHPQFAPDGQVVVRPGERGEVPQIGRPRVIGHAVGPNGEIALAILRSETAFRLDISLEVQGTGTTSGRAVSIPSYGPTAGFYGVNVTFSPGGGEVAVTTPDLLSPTRPDDLLAVVDLRSGRAIEALASKPYHGLAWSPDGQWLALSTGDRVLVYGPARTDPVYVLPVPARTVAWVS